MTSIKRTTEQEEEEQQPIKIQKMEEKKEEDYDIEVEIEDDSEKENETEEESEEENEKELVTDLSVVKHIVITYSNLGYKNYIFLENHDHDLKTYKDKKAKIEKEEKEKEKEEEDDSDVSDKLMYDLFDFYENDELTVKLSLERLKGLATFYKEVEELELEDDFGKFLYRIQEAFRAEVEDPSEGFISVSEFIDNHEAYDLKKIIKSCGLSYFVIFE
jgi:hypothetical protein